MKSSPMSDHTPDGTGNGGSKPAGYRCPVLKRWQVAHARTKSWTWRRMSRKWKSHRRRWSVRCTPSCPSSCTVVRISSSSGEDRGMYSRPSNVTRPSVTAHGAPRKPAAISSRMATRAGWPAWSCRSAARRWPAPCHLVCHATTGHRQRHSRRSTCTCRNTAHPNQGG